MKKLIDVYPYKLQDGIPLFLILKRSSKKIYANQWRMVGGKVEEGETRWEAALRELMEETHLTPVKFWVIPSINQFYEAKSDLIHSIPAFAAEIDPENEIKLDKEHTEHRWIPVSEIDNYIPWTEQRRLMKLTNTILTDNSYKILPEWQIDIS
jgi:dATP pyrophosphohydrolase